MSLKRSSTAGSALSAESSSSSQCSRARRARKLPPFPRQQMLILAMCRICEPIAFMSIFPYIYYMIEDFHITDDPNSISVYAGMVTSAFTLAEFATGLMWGRLSDKVGRKPILLTGLAGTGLSVLIFGFAPNLPVALFARTVGGLLNGNIGVLQTTVAELVTVKEHQPRAYTIMPLVWCLGSIIGPMIGGALARPCISYPDLFPRGTIFDRFPYLLPNLFSACAVLMGVFIGILFLEETHADKKHRRDAGRELGKALTAWARRALDWLPVCCVSRARRDEKQKQKQSLLLLLPEDDEPLPRYGAVDEGGAGGGGGNGAAAGGPDLATVAVAAQDPQDPLGLVEDVDVAVPEPPAAAPVKAFTRPVVLNIIQYGILAFHTMTFDQLFPVFLSTTPPSPKPPVHLPFKFVDGFGLETKTIGFILSIQGLYSMFSTVVLFPMVAHRLGPLRLFRILALSYFMLYLVTPYLVLLPDHLRMPAIYAIIVWKCTFSTLAYPSNAILLTNAAPSLTTLGTINGVAASTASLCRAFGPTLSGLLYSLGLDTGYSGLAWWFSGAVTIVGAVISLRITDGAGRFDSGPTDEEAGDSDAE
jgi:predicted MFS family arabinose efflux permease